MLILAGYNFAYVPTADLSQPDIIWAEILSKIIFDRVWAVCEIGPLGVL